MNESFDPAASVVIVAIIFFSFYVVGSTASRKKVVKIGSSIQQAVAELGGKTTAARFGVSAAVLSFKGLGNMEQFSVVVGISSWANPLSYVISRVMKKKDLLILRGKISKPPSSSFTLIHKDSPAMRYADRWGTFVDRIDSYVLFSVEENAPKNFVEQVVSALRPLDILYLVSFSKELPHLHVYASPSEPEKIKTLLSILKKLI